MCQLHIIGRVRETLPYQIDNGFCSELSVQSLHSRISYRKLIHPVILDYEVERSRLQIIGQEYISRNLGKEGYNSILAQGTIIRLLELKKVCFRWQNVKS